MDEADEEADVVFESLADSEVEFDLEPEISRNLKCTFFYQKMNYFCRQYFRSQFLEQLQKLLQIPQSILRRRFLLQLSALEL